MSGLDEKVELLEGDAPETNPVLVTLSDSIDSHIKHVSMDDFDVVEMTSYTKTTFREIVSKYKHLKSQNDKSTNEYLQRIKKWADNLSNIYEEKQSKYIKDYGYTNEIHVKFFQEMFTILATFLFNLQFISATFKEFGKDIQFTCNIKYDRITLNLIKQLKLWQDCYGSELDNIINKIAGDLVFTENSKLFAKKSLYHLANNAEEFIAACYKGNYLIFVAEYVHCTLQYMLEKDPNSNPCHIVNDIIPEFIEVLNDKKNFMKMLFKSMQKQKRHSVQLSNDIGWVADISGVEVYPKILAIMIVCLQKLENKNPITMSKDDRKKLIEQCDVVMSKCGELNMGEQPKAMVRKYFGNLLNPEEGDQVCQLACVNPLGPDCVIL